MTRTRFPGYVWGLLAYNIAVVLWGAYVRASFSGDGCGADWPTCGGQIFPPGDQVKTLVEYTHRVTSGLCLPLVILLGVGAYKAYPRRHPVRTGSLLAILFTFSEALIGAGLVLFRWVAHNPSLYHAVAISAHLTNTFLLLAALTLTGWWSSGGAVPRWKGQGKIGWLFAAALIGTLALGITGSIAALGDSIFPAANLMAGIKQDFSPTASYLLRIRPLHPMVAIVVGLFLVGVSLVTIRLRPDPNTRFFGRSLMVIFCLQIAVGFLNLMLRAPIWTQLEHLLVADLLWVLLILLTASALAQETPVSASEASVSESIFAGKKLANL